jgi:hypothetical protein
MLKIRAIAKQYEVFRCKQMCNDLLEDGVEVEVM